MEMKTFRNEEDFNAFFRNMAELNGDEFNDTLCINGNACLDLSYLRELVDTFGYDRVSVSDWGDGENTHVSDINIRIFGWDGRGNVDLKGDRISFSNGIIEMWFD